MSKAKLIVIDGTDGSGKATQAALLVKSLKKHMINAVGLDFPQYQTFFGKLVAQYLKNHFGRISPYLASVLYAANRMEFKDKLYAWVKEGKTVVLNRYVSSNQIHQAANIDTKKERNKFVKWIGKMEYEIIGLPKPDLVVFLNVPAEISYKLIEQKEPQARRYAEGAKRDLLESDLEHQQRALTQSFDMLNKHYKWLQIDCVKKGKLRSKEDISEEIWQSVNKLLRLKK